MGQKKQERLTIPELICVSEESEEPQDELSKPAKVFGSLWAALALLTVFTYWQSPLLLNLASAFRFQLVIVLWLMSIGPLVLFPKRKKLLFLAVPGAVSLTFASYFISPVANLEATGTPVSVAVANIYSGNRDLTRLSQWLSKQQPELVCVLEVATHHQESLRALGYQHLTIEPRENNFGLALLSKKPPVSVRVLDKESPVPSILVEFETYAALLTHPVPPLDGETREMGDKQIERLAELIAQEPKPVLVLGDLNATGWDLRLFPFEEIGLRDARKGFGMVPTWPVGRPIMHIPIDHILVPEKWAVSSFERGPDIGSDHYPLSAVIHLPESK